MLSGIDPLSMKIMTLLIDKVCLLIKSKNRRLKENKIFLKPKPPDLINDTNIISKASFILNYENREFS